MRDRRQVLSEIEEDEAARRAGLGMKRMQHDPAFRRRYGRYIRGEIGWPEVLQGETHEEWYRRVCADR